MNTVAEDIGKIRTVLQDPSTGKILRSAQLDLCDLLDHLLPLRPHLSSLYLAGGAIVSTVLNEPVKDYDFFCKTKYQAEFLRKIFSEMGVGVHGPLHIKAITDRAVSFTSSSFKKNYPYFQIITKWYGQPKEVISKFDYVHCMSYFNGSALYTYSAFPELCSRKVLRRNPTCQEPPNPLRLKKFLRRGWHVEDERDEGFRLLRELDLHENEEEEKEPITMWWIDS